MQRLFLKNIFQKIEELKVLSESILNSPTFEKEGANQDIALQIKAFNEIINECKLEIKSTNHAHKEHILRTLYNLDICELTPKAIDNKIDDFIKNQIGFSDDYEEKINLMKKILQELEDILESLKFKYQTFLFKTKTPLFLQKNKLGDYEKKIQQIESIKNSLQTKLELFSEHLANHIIENFYTFFIFISFLITTPKLCKNEMLLLKVANILDRYIDIIEPALSNRSLHYKDMIYHYALFEVKELKEQVLKGIF